MKFSVSPLIPLTTYMYPANRVRLLDFLAVTCPADMDLTHSSPSSRAEERLATRALSVEACPIAASRWRWIPLEPCMSPASLSPPTSPYPERRPKPAKLDWVQIAPTTK